MKIRRILVPTDFSEPSLKALDDAIELAKSLGGAEVAVLFVEGLFTYGLAGDLMSSAAAARFLEEHRQEVKKRLEELRTRIEKSGLRARAILTEGVPWHSIGDVARRMRADLVVMSTHGRTGLSHVLMGSVAERVVRTAPCPVLTVRPAPPPARAGR